MDAYKVFERYKMVMLHMPKTTASAAHLGKDAKDVTIRADDVLSFNIAIHNALQRYGDHIMFVRVPPREEEGRFYCRLQFCMSHNLHAAVPLVQIEMSEMEEPKWIWSEG